MNISVVNSKIGPDGLSGFSWDATIAVDGVPVFDVRDNGDGGELKYTPLGRHQEYNGNVKKLLEVTRYARRLPPLPVTDEASKALYPDGIPMTLDLFISDLVDQHCKSPA